MKLLRSVAIVLSGVILLLGGGVMLLFVTAPGPREAPGWELGSPLPGARGELATAVAHAAPCPEPPCPELERLFVVGGMSGLGSADDRVSIYDPSGGAWRAGPPLPAPRHHLAAAALGGAVYASGGTDDRSRPWVPHAELWRLARGAERWEALVPMPEPRWGHRMVALGGRLYVVGGQGPTSRVLIFEPGIGWRSGAEMPRPRDHLSAVAVHGRIWAIGGRAPHSLARVDIYDPDTDRWEPGPDLPLPTSGAAEGVVGGRVLVLGGEEPARRGEVYDRHWMLDPAAPEVGWRPAPPPPLPVHGADGAVFQGDMLIAGGASRHGLLSVTAWTDAVQRLDAGSLAPLDSDGPGAPRSPEPGAP